MRLGFADSAGHNAMFAVLHYGIVSIRTQRYVLAPLEEAPLVHRLPLLSSLILHAFAKVQAAC